MQSAPTRLNEIPRRRTPAHLSIEPRPGSQGQSTNLPSVRHPPPQFSLPSISYKYCHRVCPYIDFIIGNIVPRRVARLQILWGDIRLPTGRTSSVYTVASDLAELHMITLYNLHRIPGPDLEALIDRELRTKFKVLGGAYVVHAIKDPDGPFEYEPIPRLFGTDRKGWLYVASGRRLSCSVASAHQSLLDPPSNQHPLGRLLQAHPVLTERFPAQRLSITAMPAQDPAQMEGHLLAGYVAEFGEAPPWCIRAL